MNAEKQHDLKKEREHLSRRRSELSVGKTRTVREARVYLNKLTEGVKTLRVRYLVHNATWNPAYSVRAVTGGKTTGLELGAITRQSTGEDWDEVKLTFSTAGALLAAEGPALAPLELSLVDEDRAELDFDTMGNVRDLRA